MNDEIPSKSEPWSFSRKCELQRRSGSTHAFGGRRRHSTEEIGRTYQSRSLSLLCALLSKCCGGPLAFAKFLVSSFLAEVPRVLDPVQIINELEKKVYKLFRDYMAFVV